MNNREEKMFFASFLFLVLNGWFADCFIEFSNNPEDDIGFTNDIFDIWDATYNACINEKWIDEDSRSDVKLSRQESNLLPEILCFNKLADPKMEPSRVALSISLLIKYLVFTYSIFFANGSTALIKEGKLEEAKDSAELARRLASFGLSLHSQKILVDLLIKLFAIGHDVTELQNAGADFSLEEKFKSVEKYIREKIYGAYNIRNRTLPQKILEVPHEMNYLHRFFSLMMYGEPVIPDEGTFVDISNKLLGLVKKLLTLAKTRSPNPICFGVECFAPVNKEMPESKIVHVLRTIETEIAKILPKKLIILDVVYDNSSPVLKLMRNSANKH